MPYVVDRLINECIDVRFRHVQGSRGCLFNAVTQTAEGLPPAPRRLAATQATDRALYELSWRRTYPVPSLNSTKFVSGVTRFAELSMLVLSMTCTD